LKRLVLLGGGHSHVEVLRRMALQSLDATVVLVSPGRHAPYSGMLPGLIAGHYAFDDCHIDLEPLCAAARVSYRATAACALDLDRNEVACMDGSRVGFDLLSLDIGSVPDWHAVPGAREHTVPVKPVPGLLAGWETIRAAAQSGPLTIAVVGGGAGGIELALAMDYRLRTEGRRNVRLFVVTETNTIVPGHPARARGALVRALEARGIGLYCNCRVTGVTRDGLEAGGRRLAADCVVWATSASAPAWILESGLATDPRGFVSVGRSLRSTSHPHVHAAGDIAAMTGFRLPKSGVYAVRQGPPLAQNLRAALSGGTPVEYVPQRTALSLISTGGRRAIASWNGLSFEGAWVWRWKDRIDRRFVATYQRVGASRSRA
jgi:selenide, water dikinase